MKGVEQAALGGGALQQGEGQGGGWKAGASLGPGGRGMGRRLRAKVGPALLPVPAWHVIALHRGCSPCTLPVQLSLHSTTHILDLWPLGPRVWHRNSICPLFLPGKLKPQRQESPAFSEDKLPSAPLLGGLSLPI